MPQGTPFFHNGFLLAILVFFASNYFEDKTIAASEIETASYRYLQRSLHPVETLPKIRLVDISDVPQVKGATPRAEIQRLIDLIASNHPKAIGIDIDFSQKQTPEQYDELVENVKRAQAEVDLGAK